MQHALVREALQDERVRLTAVLKHTLECGRHEPEAQPDWVVAAEQAMGGP